MDTLFIDIAGHDLFECRLMLTWRLIFDLSTAQSLVLFDVGDEERAWFIQTPGALQSPPLPGEACHLMDEEEARV